MRYSKSGQYKFSAGQSSERKTKDMSSDFQTYAYGDLLLVFANVKWDGSNGPRSPLILYLIVGISYGVRVCADRRAEQ